MHVRALLMSLEFNVKDGTYTHEHAVDVLASAYCISDIPYPFYMHVGILHMMIAYEEGVLKIKKQEGGNPPQLSTEKQEKREAPLPVRRQQSNKSGVFDMMRSFTDKVFTVFGFFMAFGLAVGMVIGIVSLLMQIVQRPTL